MAIDAHEQNRLSWNAASERHSLHKGDYMGGALIEEHEVVGDYVGLSGDSLKLGHQVDRDLPGFHNPHPAMAYPWGLGETVGALLKAGLQIESLREHPYSNGWKPFPEMRDLPGGRKSMPGGHPNLPMMFSVVANKPVEAAEEMAH